MQINLVFLIKLAIHIAAFFPARLVSIGPIVLYHGKEDSDVESYNSNVAGVSYLISMNARNV